MIYAIGDVHGCLAELNVLLEAFRQRDNASSEDTLIFMGDYIDRGPASKGVIDAILAMKQEHLKTITLRGNHEQMILDAAQLWDDHPGYGTETDEFVMWWRNGGKEAASSYGCSKMSWRRGIPKEHWDFFKATRDDYKEGGYYFVHAGVLPPETHWTHKNWDPRLWIKEDFIYYMGDLGEYIIVFGHTPTIGLYPQGHPDAQEPLVMHNKIGIDTGGVFGGKLTMAIFDPEKNGEKRLDFSYVQV